MIASLILSNASTAGIMSAGAVQSLGVERKLNLDKMVKGSIFGGKLVLKGLNKLFGKGGLTGINFSLSSILRQSQIFTTTVGSFFQLAGAYLDMSLAPLMPKIMKGLIWLSTQLPKYTALIDGFVRWIGPKWEVAKIKLKWLFDSIEYWKGLYNRLLEAWRNISTTEGWKDRALKELEAFDEQLTFSKDKGVMGNIETAITWVGGMSSLYKMPNIGPLGIGPYGSILGLGQGGLIEEPFVNKNVTGPALDTGGGGGVYGAFTGAAIPQKTPSVFKPESSAILPGAMLMRPEFGVADRRENNQSISQTHGQFGRHVGATIGQASGGGDSAGTTNILTTFFRNEGNDQAAQRMIANEAIMTRSGGSVHSLNQPKVQTYQAIASLHGSSVSIARESSQARTARTNIINRYF